MDAPHDLRSFLHNLEEHGELQRIKVPVDPHLEVAEIHRRQVMCGGPALLFENVKGHHFRVVTNLFGSPKRVQLAFGSSLPQTLELLVDTLMHPPANSKALCKKFWQNRRLLNRFFHLGTKSSPQSHLQETNLSLNDLPFLTSWPMDGGPFLTLPLVYTNSPMTARGSQSPNLGIYRIQRFDEKTAGLHFQIGKGAGFHLWQAEQQNLDLPISIFLGGSPALVAAAVAPLPENVNELLLASALIGKKIKTFTLPNWPHPILQDAEFAILGRSPHGKRRLEGPFGDHYGYYSLAHDFPLLQVEKILARSDAIYPATIVGKPPQEDLYLGHWLQDLLKPLISLAMPGVLDLWSYGESGFHALAAARVRERYERESLTHALRILGEGQLALTKFLLITDQPVDVRNIKSILTTVLERLVPQTDVYILSNLCLDTLDYTGPSLNKGSRGVFVGLGPSKRKLPTSWEQSLPSPFTKAQAFCPGCLLVQGPRYENEPTLAKNLANDALKAWPLIILVDEVQECLSDAGFLWTVFMRFEPARDIYSRHSLHHYHICHEFPLVIDARMKPSYPPVVEVDDKTRELVDQRWHHYFS